MAQPAHIDAVAEPSERRVVDRRILELVRHDNGQSVTWNRSLDLHEIHICRRPAGNLTCERNRVLAEFGSVHRKACPMLPRADGCWDAAAGQGIFNCARGTSRGAAITASGT